MTNSSRGVFSRVSTRRLVRRSPEENPEEEGYIDIEDEEDLIEQRDIESLTNGHSIGIQRKPSITRPFFIPDEDEV